MSLKPLWEPRYDEVRRAFFKMGRYKPLPPQSAARKTISRVARFTEEEEKSAVLFYTPRYLERRMMHCWAIHCLLSLPEQPEFFDTYDYVNDNAYQAKGMPSDFFAVLPWYMHVKAAVRFALYNTPVVHKPSFAFPLREKGAFEFLGGISKGLLSKCILQSKAWRPVELPSIQPHKFTMQIPK